MDQSQHIADHQRTIPAVDWSRPIEAVHEDGRIVSASVDWKRSPDRDGDHWISVSGEIGMLVAGDDDRRISPICHGWRIRNVQPTTPERDPALWDRMVAYIRADVRDYAQGAQAEEGRAILAEVDPVDPDLLAVRQMVADAVPGIDKDKVLRGGFDDTVSIKVPLACLKRGRELATPEVSHVG